MPSNSIRSITIPDLEEERRRRAETAKRELRRRLDDLPPDASDWAATLTLECDEAQFLRLLEAFVFVLNGARANGSAAVPIIRADLASAVGVNPAQAGALLSRLEQAGMVERRVRMIGQPDLYRPLRAGDAHRRSTKAAPVASTLSRRHSSPLTDKRLISGLLGMRA